MRQRSSSGGAAAPGPAPSPSLQDTRTPACSPSPGLPGAARHSLGTSAMLHPGGLALGRGSLPTKATGAEPVHTERRAAPAEGAEPREHLPGEELPQVQRSHHPGLAGQRPRAGRRPERTVGAELRGTGPQLPPGDAAGHPDAARAAHGLRAGLRPLSTQRCSRSQARAAGWLHSGFKGPPRSASAYSGRSHQPQV